MSTKTYSTGRSETFSAPLWLETEDCCNCHIAFAMPTDFVKRARQDTTISFYCPNGHRQHYTGKSIESKLRDAEARLTAQQDQLEAAVRDAEAIRYALLRDRQRFANGVCPCCNRTFENVRRHMSSKHPDYDSTRINQPSAIRYRCSCSRSFESVRGLRIHQGQLRDTGWATPGTPGWRAHLTKV